MAINDDFYTRYTELESRIRSLMIELFSETCGLCTACCCRADICEEATESAFLLKLLEQQGLNPDQIDDRFGWLDLHGCSLEYGRPPVCYAYYCDELLARLPDEEARYASQMLGKLMYHIGLNALGGWHLTEIMDAKDLDKVNGNALLARLSEAETAYSAIEQFTQSGRLSLADREALASITTEEP